MNRYFSDNVIKIMFDYETIDDEKIIMSASSLPQKIIRWIAENHPDNRIRKELYRLTNIEIGEGTVINKNFIVSDSYAGLLKIGKRVAISPNVTIICDSGPNNSNIKHISYVKEKLITDEPVVIGNDVWIGTMVTILPGVEVGDGVIIGAGSVVTKNIPPHTIFAGVPAVEIRKIGDGS